MTHLIVSLNHFANHHFCTQDMRALEVAVRADFRDELAWLAFADAVEEAGIALGWFRNYIDEYFHLPF